MMKKLKQILVLLAMLFTVSVTFAQQDADCSIKYNLFKGDYKAGNYAGAYDNWLWVMDNCPSLSVNIYKMGSTIAQYKLDNAKTAEEKASAAKVMERVYTQRLQYYPQNLGVIYNDYATFKIDQGASEDVIFPLLEKAFKADPTDLSAKNIYMYFDIVLNKYKDSDTQKVFDTYDEVLEGVNQKRAEYSKKIDLISSQDSSTVSDRDLRNKNVYQQILGNLSLVEEGLDAKLAEISTCDRLIPFYNKYFDDKKSDSLWLKRAVSRMYAKECTSDPMYPKLVEAYVNADPSPAASVFYGGILMDKGQTDKALGYFKQAVEHETDSYKKAGYLLQIAQALSKKGNKVEARDYAYKAISFAPSMGRAYLLISSMYATSANSCGDDILSKRMVFVAALNMAVKAKAVDPSITNLANKFISNYASNLPTKKDIFVAGQQSGASFKIGCWINETVRVP